VGWISCCWQTVSATIRVWAAAEREGAPQGGLEILDAFVIAMDRRDELMHIVSDTVDGDEAILRLKRVFALDDAQAHAVLDLQVRRFAGRQRQQVIEDGRCSGYVRVTLELLAAARRRARARADEDPPPFVSWGPLL
jgi:DNA gyrase/topoisomerase IV subunit A